MGAMVEDESATKFLIDGFPRELKQAKEFEEEVGINSSCFIHSVFYLPGEPQKDSHF